ncbi:hypothetical protein P3388_25635, partial [Vibrio parahaemolyticus]|nr:hypothetical protein [Vibrio parahaemolyticus]
MTQATDGRTDGQTVTHLKQDKHLATSFPHQISVIAYTRMRKSAHNSMSSHRGCCDLMALY